MTNDDGDSLPGSSSFDRALMDKIFKAVSTDANDSRNGKVVNLEVLRETFSKNDDEKTSSSPSAEDTETSENDERSQSVGLFSDIQAYFGDRKEVTRMNNSNRKPLVIITPKYLLHHRRCQSLLEDFDERSSFRRVICDGDAGDQLFNDGDNTSIAQKQGDEIRKVLLCSGKIWYDLSRHRTANKIDDVILVRLEQIFPFPYDALARRLTRFPNASRPMWCGARKSRRIWALGVTLKTE